MNPLPGQVGSRELERDLSSLSVRRVVLIGPDGPSLRWAAAWALARPGTAVVRRAGPGPVDPQSVLISERAELLPTDVELGVMAIVPESEAQVTAMQGWQAARQSAGGLLLLRRAVQDQGKAPIPNQADGQEQGHQTQSPARAGPLSVSVIVSVDPAADGDGLRRCLTSLARHTTWPAEVLIIDDGVRNPAVLDQISTFAALSNVRLLRNAESMGAARALERGWRASSGDVVWLNCQAEVGPRWLEHLVLVSRAPAVARVSGISDGWVQPQADPVTVMALGVEGLARLVAQTGSKPIAAKVPDGLCTYLVRAAAEFDAIQEPERSASWVELVDRRTFIHTTAGRPPRTEHGADASVVQLRRIDEAPRQRVMLVAGVSGGAGERADRELASALEPEWEPMVLTADDQGLALTRMSQGSWEAVSGWPLEREATVRDISRPDYRRSIVEALIDNEIELLHVRDLRGHTLDSISVARQLGIPVLLELRDTHLVMPEEIAPTQLAEWREDVELVLRDVDAFVGGSENAIALARRALPAVGGAPCEVIECGPSPPQRAGVAIPPSVGGRIRILVPGPLEETSGAGLIRSLVSADHGHRLEFHFLGTALASDAELGIDHGAVPPTELTKMARQIEPAFLSCLSDLPVMNSDRLAEAWALGVPVLGSDFGTIGEMIRAQGGGCRLPAEDPEAAVRRLYELADDPAAYAAMRDQASLRNLPSRLDTADAYTASYRRVLDARRSIVSGVRLPGLRYLRRGVVLVRAVVRGSHGVHPGSAYVRILQRYRHPDISWKLSTSIRCAHEDPLRAPADVVIVQRTALEPGQAPEFIAQAQRLGLRLVLDLDDHLLAKGIGDAEYGPHLEDLTRLIGAADLVLTSTQRLREAMSDQARHVELVPNLIDERLFLSGGVDAPSATSVQREGALRLVYVGSPTHERDLELLRPVIDELRERLRGGVELYVVGGERPGPGQEWYSRVVVPDSCKPYPAFVRWLRKQRPRWDVGLAPLVDDEFNSYKSDLKYLEYAALGLPAIYSDLAPYASVVPGRTGLKVNGSTEEWAEAICALGQDPSLRRQIAAAAFEEVTASRLLRHGSESLLELICGIVGVPI